MRTGRENGWLCLAYSLKMAGVTGLEPAASGVTGRRSNQLSYTPYLVSWLSLIHI